MPQDPNDKVQRAADAFRLQIQKQVDAATKAFESRSEQMRRAFGNDVGSMYEAFKAFTNETSAEGTALFNDLKSALRQFATFAPKEFEKAGLSIDEVMSEVAQGATRMSDEHISITKARYSRIRQILGQHGVEAGALDGATYEVFENNLDGYISYVQEYMQDRLLMVKGNTAEEAKIVAEAQKKILASVTGRIQAQTNLEKKLVAAAQSRVNQSTTQALTNKGLIGQLARGSLGQRLGLADVAAAEQAAFKAAGKAGGADVGLAGIQRTLQAAVGGFSQLATAIMPAVASMGAMALLVKELLTAFDRAKRQGAGMLEVMSVQGDNSSASMMDSVAAGHDLRVALQGVRDSAFGTAAQVDDTSVKALEMAKAMGGLGKSADDVVVGLTAVGIAAPVAGMQAEQAMDMVARAQRLFGLSGQKQMMEYFNAVRISARVAGLGTQEFLEAAGGIDEIAKSWGESSGRIVGAGAAITRVMAGISSTPAIRGMLTGAFTSLGRMQLSQTLALQQFAFGGTTKMAGQRIQKAMAEGGQGIIASNMDALSKALKDRGLFGANKRVELGLFLEKSPFGQMQGLSRLLFGEQKTANQVLRALQSGSAKDLADVQKKIEKAAVEDDPIRKGAQLASNQLDTLKQLQLTVSEGLQNIIAWLETIGRFFGGGDAGRSAAAAKQYDRILSEASVQARAGGMF